MTCGELRTVSETPNQEAAQQAAECREFREQSELRELRGKLAEIQARVVDGACWTTWQGVELSRRELRKICER